MKKLFILAFIVLLPAVFADAAKVRLLRGILTYTTETEYGNIEITFRKCMANNLFTFSSVKLNGTEVNSTASSDNIGPFMLNGGYWTGGNHNNTVTGNPTANTLYYSVMVDSQELTGNASVEGDILDVYVRNELLYTDGQKFCTEEMSYRVSGNSIEVWGEHSYEYPTPLTIQRYYGMQSMFLGETEVLLPGTPYNTWKTLTVTSSGNEIYVPKSKAPNFCTYIEHSANGYQAAYMLREDLGNREWVGDNDNVYYGNSWSKSYHTLIWYHPINAGDTSSWHGIYTWFDKPLTDTFRGGNNPDPKFEYGGYIDGEPVIFSLGADGKMSDTAGIGDTVVDSDDVFAVAGQGYIAVSESASHARCFDTTGKLIHEGSGSFSCRPGLYIVTDMNGHSIKLIVK